jgi:hypothetical protein
LDLFSAEAYRPAKTGSQTGKNKHSKATAKKEEALMQTLPAFEVSLSKQ